MSKKSFIIPTIFAVGIGIGIFLMRYINSGTNYRIANISNSDTQLINNVLSLIDNDYVDTVNLKQLQVKAIEKVLETLDPHSEYIPAEMFNEINDPLLGSFEGIGISFRIEKDTVMVVSVIKGGPSERIGLKAGDRIVAVDDSIVAGVKINNNKIMRKLKGPKGTNVNVRIKRRDVPELIDFTIKRDVIPTFSVDASFMLDKEIGYVKMSKFAATTHKEFVSAAQKLLKEGMKHLVIDLRDNGGGFLSAAVDIADEILPKGSLIVYTDGKHRDRQYIFARKTGLLEDTEITVLIDEGSASASEILAGAIQDNDRGTIMGRRSFGKGLVQEQMMLPDGDALRLTVAHYYTPTGRCIQKPYDGDMEKYILEAYDRYNTGEMFSVDSVKHTDTLKFVTPQGKIVYGGGGITPDIYIPLVNDSLKYYFNRVSNAGIVFKNAAEYADNNRNALAAAGFDHFKKSFRLTNDIFDKIIMDAEEKGIKGNDEEKNIMRTAAAPIIKAYVAREIFDEEAFYRLYTENDETVKTCLREIKKITQ